MKTLIVYFSLGGNTKWIAEKIYRKLPGATLHVIELEKEPLKIKWLRTMVYGFKTTFYKKMAIKNSNLDMSQYDAVVIGSPVWAGNLPPPVRAFLDQYSITGKKVAAFCSMGGEPSKFFDNLQELAAIDKLEASLSIVEPLANLNKATFEKVNDFVNEVAEAFDFFTNSPSFHLNMSKDL